VTSDMVRKMDIRARCAAPQSSPTSQQSSD